MATPMVHHFSPLLAADFTQFIIFVFLVGGSIISQIVKARQEKAKLENRQRDREQADRQRQADRRGRPPAAGAAEKPSPQTDIDRELEEFLGRKVERQPNKSPVQPDLRRNPAPKRPAKATEVVPPPQPGANKSARKRPAPKRLADSVTSGGSVSGHVQQHMREGNVTAHSSQLGASLSQADERLESRLHQTFDHRVGQLGGITASIAEGTDATYGSAGLENATPTALRLREMLDAPQDIRAAFLLAEIIRRPEERWTD